MSQNVVTNLSQQEINEREWNNPQNWHYSFYHSRVDTRTFVPRRWLGTTVNFGRPGVFWCVAALMLAPLVLAAGVLISRAL